LEDTYVSVWEFLCFWVFGEPVKSDVKKTEQIFSSRHVPPVGNSRLNGFYDCKDIDLNSGLGISFISPDNSSLMRINMS